MPLVLLDGSTVRDFVKDEQAFQEAMKSCFQEMDLNEDGSLSRAELRTAFERMSLLECSLGFPISQTPAQLNALYDPVFEKFDTDHSGNVDFNEFCTQMSEILLAIVDALGSSPTTLEWMICVIWEGGIKDEDHANEKDNKNQNSK
ncbi:hypothetical protein KP509_14G044000 [Ceratopteris richardii]|uniref:EF-hand domain-containing protein n=1 Tax=Ceratopteris richardii TaxID=49495 RepID=A0A8T2TBC5_CERRI|nr:hypothetical protein KP509_14G044000 [Ceratopteris richardii]